MKYYIFMGLLWALIHELFIDRLFRKTAESEWKTMESEISEFKIVSRSKIPETTKFIAYRMLIHILLWPVFVIWVIKDCFDRK